jgi:hypothetical protein
MVPHHWHFRTSQARKILVLVQEKFDCTLKKDHGHDTVHNSFFSMDFSRSMTHKTFVHILLVSSIFHAALLKNDVVHRYCVLSGHVWFPSRSR